MDREAYETWRRRIRYERSREIEINDRLGRPLDYDTKKTIEVTFREASELLDMVVEARAEALYGMKATTTMQVEEGPDEWPFWELLDDEEKSEYRAQALHVLGWDKEAVGS